ncbi:1-acyl-sn-glycerol-3-phosphate acyltransferase [Fodinibius salinus]|uniref:1-acyl-sn-glycerol-3-phosphate acyltransferase n=1 Tax=Fodinibius salinus TaxID=860790 RepID=A0A5D3YR60_9BACT|nr:lysophospholipid acyltransferase family protein [Fodinibius salinus]TYP95493.1 1-acyl-sn-glycerol-3-phosphate acyltransferase [Fodinibius salinus]
MDFIPANESPVFIKGFRWYTWLLFKRRFHKVWLRQDYYPKKESKTVYYLNHHSWWDGLVPFLLNEFRFHQQARALMEDTQMKKYPLFQKIGAFSINRDDRRQAITSLRYAVNSFEREQASLFIYPEGTITPPGLDMNFEGGLAWLYGKLHNVDFVPIGIYMHTIRHDKPELHLHVGKSDQIGQLKSGAKLTHHFEERLNTILDDLRTTAGFDDTNFEPFA